MKKLFILLALIGFILNSQCAFSYQIKADATTARLEKGTKLNLIMVEPLTTAEMNKGDMFSARLSNDIRQNGKTVLPAGSLVRGNVDDFKNTAILSRSAVLYLTFDHIVTPQGRQIPIRAGVINSFDIMEDGSISGGGNYFSELKRNAITSGQIIAKTTKWGYTAGDDLFNGGRFLITPIAAIGGGVCGVLYLVGDSIIDIFRKGNDVIIDQNKAFDVILLEPLDVPLM